MSTDYSLILEKIQHFIQKYYVNKVIKGFLIFLAVGLLYLFSILVLENLLWLSTTIRTILFWTFIVVSIYLFVRFIGISLAKLINLGKQISPIEASKIIGNHFPEVDDQLINLLQLKTTTINSELLEATIEQKSKQLSPIPFSTAINFKNSFSFAKYAMIPIVLFFLFSLFKGFDWYKNSLDRVVNYDVAYTPPAPFYFKILNQDLTALQNNDFTLNVTTYGNTIPDQVQIKYNSQTYFLQQTKANVYSYTFNSLKKSMDFNLQSGDIFSNQYKITVNEAPLILDFNLKVTSPKHVKQPVKNIPNSGNALVAEGSVLEWKVKGKNANQINFIYNDSTYSFTQNNQTYNYSKTSKENFGYQIATSNSYVSNYEKLDFNIEVIKDKHPLINVLSKKDSSNTSKQFYYGRLSDDYGISKLNIVYYNIKTPDQKQFKRISIKTGLTSEFTYQFPSNLELNEAEEYAFYFQVYDNDSYNGAKFSKSETFNYRVSSNIEKKQIDSQSQQQELNEFQNTIEKFQQSELDLESFSKIQKQSLSTSFKEKEKLSTVLEKQFKQQKKLEKLSEKLSKTLEKITEDKKEENPTKEELERAKKELEKNKKLIEQIKKEMEKLEPKALQEKVEELKKENKKITKNLSQILELTKRYYVIEKHQRVVQMLELLSEKEIEASKKNIDLAAQQQMNKEFKIIRKELDDLRDSNSKLRKPMVLDDDSVYEGKIESKQNEATENIKKSVSDTAKKKQNLAGIMMKNLADKMSKSASASAGEDLKEDKEALRQILDNLVLFSINQEENMLSFSKSNVNNPNYSKHIRTQNKLQEHFNHIDDSLYSIASRNPKIGTKINDLISDIDYNLDSSLESMTDNKTYQGVTKLRFAIANSNDLAVMLSQSLKQMNQRQKPGKGKPKENKGFQLPDIIKKQESLNKAFKKALQGGEKKPGESKKEGEGGKKKPGKSGDEGKEGEQGEKGKDGKSGESGESGQDGQSGKEGKDGKSGESGQGGENGQSGEDGSFGIGQGKDGKGKGNSQQSKGEDGDGKGESKGSKPGKGKGKNSDDQNKESNSSGGKGESKKGAKTSQGNDSNWENKGKSKGKGKGKGKGEGVGSGEGSGDDENDYEQLFEIYKQQQDLRNQLENRLSQEGISRDQTRVLDQMKQVEDELIEKGFNTETLNRMLNLKHQLFKLEKAQFQQGKDTKRKSKTNAKSYISNEKITPEEIKKYFNSTEILNRDALPLRPDYEKKVNEYFNK